MVQDARANAGDTGDVGLTPGVGRSPEGGDGSPLLLMEGYSPWGHRVRHERLSVHTRMPQQKQLVSRYGADSSYKSKKSKTKD